MAVHMYNLDSFDFMLNCCVAYQLVTLLGKYIHWSWQNLVKSFFLCEKDLHISKSQRII